MEEEDNSIEECDILVNYGNEEENADSEVVCEDSTGGINDSEFECESLENDLWLPTSLLTKIF